MGQGLRAALQRAGAWGTGGLGAGLRGGGPQHCFFSSEDTFWSSLSLLLGQQC